jgi:hypothetical protein
METRSPIGIQLIIERVPHDGMGKVVGSRLSRGANESGLERLIEAIEQGLLWQSGQRLQHLKHEAAREGGGEPEQALCLLREAGDSSVQNLAHALRNAQVADAEIG